MAFMLFKPLLYLLSRNANAINRRFKVFGRIYIVSRFQAALILQRHRYEMVSSLYRYFLHATILSVPNTSSR